MKKVTHPIFGEFEKKLMGHVIDYDDLIIQEPIGEGNL